MFFDSNGVYIGNLQAQQQYVQSSTQFAPIKSVVVGGIEFTWY